MTQLTYVQVKNAVDMMASIPVPITVMDTSLFFKDDSLEKAQKVVDRMFKNYPACSTKN
jgi:hypothetical protein